MNGEDVDEETLIQNLSAAVDEQSAARLEHAAWQASIYCGTVDDDGMYRYSDRLFETCLTLLQQPELQHMEGSWHLLMMFGSVHAYQLTEDQKSRLLPALETVYNEFTDWMACYVMTEIIGEAYCDEPAFEALCRLSECNNEMARSLIPHGFEHLARDGPGDLSQRALEALRCMGEDDSQLVRDEVVTWLQRLETSQDTGPHI